MSNNKPIITPPIQRATLPYYLTRELVKQGVRRFHRLIVFEGQENLPKGRNPIILVSNHQNGLMDPMITSGLLKPQLHWLTRADIFWNPIVRKILLVFNQLPIYRKRDRVPDLKERNKIIWNCCIERLECGAALSLFPEGNHNPQKTIRPLKPGLSELLGLAVSKHETLKRLKVIPIGIDYENYPEYRRSLSFRMGKEIEWSDLYDDKSKSVDFNQLTDRIIDGMRKLSIDIRPHAIYDDLYPYVRALRSSQAKGEKWLSIIKELDRISKVGENKKWCVDVVNSANSLREAGFVNSMRSESWGIKRTEVTKTKMWAVLLVPISWVANIPTSLQQFLINWRGDNINAIEFRSTIKVGVGMFVYPISWTLIAILAGVFTQPFWVGFVGIWTWATFGNKFYGWLQGHLYDHKDAIEGLRFWEDAGNEKLRTAWVHYIETIKKDISS